MVYRIGITDNIRKEQKIMKSRKRGKRLKREKRKEPKKNNTTWQGLGGRELLGVMRR